MTEQDKCKIRLLLNHILCYSDMLRTDAIILGYSTLVDYFGNIMKEIAEIKRILVHVYPQKKDDVLFVKVVREEIARHLYIIREIVDDISVQQEFAQFPKFEDFVFLIKGSVSEVINCFEKTLDAASQKIAIASVGDVRKFKENLPVYSNEFVEIKENIDNGSILFAGNFSQSTNILNNMLNEKGFHIVTMTPDQSIVDVLNSYEVCLICFDCGENPLSIENLITDFNQTDFSRSIPFMVCGTSFSDLIVARFVQLGAFDYFSPNQSRRVIMARIQSALKANLGNYKNQLYIRALEMNKSTMLKEFCSASAYVTGLLPLPFKDNNFCVDWSFLPSAELGGDIFGYSWISEKLFAIFLIDVSGHGVESSLFSVTVMNLLKNRLLLRADFSNPASVLLELNSIFKIEEQNNMFFTAWYGVYNVSNRLLTYASAGNQPAILYPPESNAEKLCSGGAAIGMDEDSVYENSVRFIPSKSDLYVFSDGIFEFYKEDGKMMGFESFLQILGGRSRKTNESCRQFVHRVENLCKDNKFDDDVSLLEIKFN